MSILETTVTPQNLFDSHCHLQFPEFSTDLPEVIERAKAAGLTKIIIPATCLADAPKAIEIAQTDPTFFEVGIGNHPYNADQTSEQCLAEFTQLIEQNRNVVTCLGETGIDTFKNKLSYEIQLEALTKQVLMCKNCDLWLILHCRANPGQETDALATAILELLQKHRITKAIFHCFGGSMTIAKTIWQNGYKTGFACNITYPQNNELLEIARACPPELRLLETDAPYLSPQSKRSFRNEPANIKDLIEWIW